MTSQARVESMRLPTFWLTTLSSTSSTSSPPNFTLLTSSSCADRLARSSSPLSDLFLCSSDSLITGKLTRTLHGSQSITAAVVRKRMKNEERGGEVREGRSFAELAGARDRAAHGVAQLLADGQPEARSTVPTVHRCVQLREALPITNTITIRVSHRTRKARLE